MPEGNIRPNIKTLLPFHLGNIWHSYQIGLIRRMILLGSHPHQAVIVEEDPQRVAGGDQDVNAQVKLVALH